MKISLYKNKDMLNKIIFNIHFKLKIHFFILQKY